MRPNREHATRNEQTYFVTSDTWGRRPLFRNERWARLFLDTLLVSDKGLPSTRVCRNARSFSRADHAHYEPGKGCAIHQGWVLASGEGGARIEYGNLAKGFQRSSHTRC